MAVVAKSRSSLHKEKCDFNNPVLNNILYTLSKIRFQPYKPSSPGKCTSEKLIAK